MELHQTGKRPDWLKRPKRDYSWFQQIAQRTNGILTPGNAITIIGFFVTLYGLWLLAREHFGAAMAVIVFGRLCDIADGWVAHRTDTKGPVGELLDATCDKIVTVLGIVALGVAGLAPWWVLALVAAPQAITSVISGLALQRKRRLHPSPVGKLSMAFAWVGFGGLILAAWADGSSWLAGIGYSCITASIVLSCYALVYYMRQYQGPAI
ncbi:CDP-alcohol phosphatidyltransferase family protein [Candidatus Saccharibacteria bacterium]|nr:MAG: CDP-alcohol phosphatidyltransferase family protein [Candidatus Saccharibacteria bacterium]